MNRILIVDDDPELRENIGELLSDEGWEVETAVDGNSALLKTREKEYDIVLTDLIMPGLQGTELAALVKHEQPMIKVVIMTAYSTVDNAVEVMRRGADDYLTKPFSGNDLLATLNRVLEEARLLSCGDMLNNDDTFSALANSYRRNILQFLKRDGTMRFMDITRKLGVEDHTKINFHLRVLKNSGLIQQDDKFYSLSTEGQQVVGCLHTLMKTLSES
ncbi:MAG: response regulator [Desulfobulbaceae bacterium]|nr:response regulator [Desulfobulbaceae bacterium]